MHVYMYLEPKWPLFLKSQPLKTRPFWSKRRIIWVPVYSRTTLIPQLPPQGVHTLVAAMRPWPTPMSRLFFVWAKKWKQPVWKRKKTNGYCTSDVWYLDTLSAKMAKKTYFLTKMLKIFEASFEINEACMLNLIYHWSFSHGHLLNKRNKDLLQNLHVFVIQT